MSSLLDQFGSHIHSINRYVLIWLKVHLDVCKLVVAFENPGQHSHLRFLIHLKV